MATARDIVTRALRKRKIVGTISASEMADGLSDLNAMLFDWQIDGIAFGHVELEAGDTIDLPANHIQTTVLNLALRLTEYGSPMEGEDVAMADDGLMRLRAAYFNVSPLETRR